MPCLSVHGCGYVVAMDKDMEQIWHRHGTDMAQTWHRRGANMVQIWQKYGTNVDIAQTRQGYAYRRALSKPLHP